MTRETTREMRTRRRLSLDADHSTLGRTTTLTRTRRGLFVFPRDHHDAASTVSLAVVMSGGLNGISPELAQLEAQYGANKKEWRYEMRREAQEIVPGEPSSPTSPPVPSSGFNPGSSTLSLGLYVGPFQPSWKLEILQGLGISHILCIAESREAQVAPFHPVGLSTT